jgi:hypothetical protein
MKKVNDFFNKMNSSKLMIGFAMIIFNIGSKYLILDMSKTQEKFFKNIIIRRLTLFCIFFVATRDMMSSLILTAVFVVLAHGVFNEESKFSVLPNSFYDTSYTKEEYEMSKKIIQNYENKNN